jgi:ribosomal protein S27AE
MIELTRLDVEQGRELVVRWSVGAREYCHRYCEPDDYALIVQGALLVQRGSPARTLAAHATNWSATIEPGPGTAAEPLPFGPPVFRAVNDDGTCPNCGGGFMVSTEREAVARCGRENCGEYLYWRGVPGT